MPETYAVPMKTMASAGESNSMLSVRNLQKVFGGRDVRTKALDGVSFDVKKGEYLAIMGPSGSGKTTLLNCISTIDRPSRGQIVAAGRDVTALSRRSLARFRRDELGFIFQDFNLLDTLTGRENIELALTIKKTPTSRIPKLVDDIALTLGVKEVLNKHPNQMSGGQKQRVAAARAIVSDPKLDHLADEPTGALDSHSAWRAAGDDGDHEPAAGGHHRHGHPRLVRGVVRAPRAVPEGRPRVQRDTPRRRLARAFLRADGMRRRLVPQRRRERAGGERRGCDRRRHRAGRRAER